MGQAIGMVEYRTVSSGILAADMIIKTADVDVIEAQIVCPGKYIFIFTGDISAVGVSLEMVRKVYQEQLIDSFLLGNPHEGIFPAIYGKGKIQNGGALGILETSSVSAILVAADEAAKTAQIKLLKIRMARGMCGKSCVFLTGDIAAVDAAIKKAEAAVIRSGKYLDSAVMANPDTRIWETIR